MKSFLELYKHDFSKESRKKPTFFKDKDGKLVKTNEDKWLDYIEWATVLVSLYRDGGATSVSYHSDIHPSKPNTLIITLLIDGTEYKSDYPIIDGNSIITSPNQMQLHKAELRGFVKCVAIHTGLGLSLWQKEESILNEIVPQDKPKEDNTQEFLDWVIALEACKTLEELGTLYNKEKKAFESSQNVKALFIKRKTELSAK